MKRHLIAAALAACFFSPAAAADMASQITAPAIDWSGFYIGGNIGGGQGNVKWDYVPAGGSADHSSHGFLGGIQGGYNWQLDSFVVGAEADFLGSNIDGSTPCPNPVFTCSSDVKWLSTVRARVGYSIESLLVYATGGLGIGGFEISTDNGAGVSGSTDRTDLGWVGGAGVEYALSTNWSVKAEYMHYDFGTRSYSVDGGLGVKAEQRFNTGKVGINYRF